MMRDLFGRVYRLSPAWLGAVAAGAVAGATVVPDRRVLAGAIGGGAVLALALSRANAVTRAVAEPGPAVTEPLEAPPSRDETWGGDYALRTARPDDYIAKGGCS
jgi:hypothetical protein